MYFILPSVKLCPICSYSIAPSNRSCLDIARTKEDWTPKEVERVLSLLHWMRCMIGRYDSDSSRQRESIASMYQREKDFDTNFVAAKRVKCANGEPIGEFWLNMRELNHLSRAYM